MKRILVLVVAVGVLLVAGSADAARKSTRGVDFEEARGSCEVTPADRAVVTCSLDQGTRARYRFRLPHGAHQVRVKVDRHDRGCCGFIDVTSTRWGAQRRHLVVEVRIRNYGNPLGSYTGVIRSVEVRYWSARA